jgi:hypothetical protein
MRDKHAQWSNLEREVGAAHHDLGTILITNAFVWGTLIAMAIVYKVTTGAQQVYLVPGATRSFEARRFWSEDPGKFSQFVVPMKQSTAIHNDDICSVQPPSADADTSPASDTNIELPTEKTDNQSQHQPENNSSETAKP